VPLNDAAANCAAPLFVTCRWFFRLDVNSIECKHDTDIVAENQAAPRGRRFEIAEMKETGYCCPTASSYLFYPRRVVPSDREMLSFARRKQTHASARRTVAGNSLATKIMNVEWRNKRTRRRVHFFFLSGRDVGLGRARDGWCEGRRERKRGR